MYNDFYYHLKRVLNRKIQDCLISIKVKNVKTKNNL